MGSKIYPTVYTCEENNSYTIKGCPPVRVDCDPVPTEGLYIDEPGDAYNCNRCPNDLEYCMPFVAGEKICIQTLFTDKINTDPLAPTLGWDEGGNFYVRAELLDKDGVVISDNVTQFASRWVVGNYSGGQYQNLELDTDLIIGLGLDCFSLRIVNFFPDGGGQSEDKDIYTEPFCLVPCEDTLTIQGTYPSGADCLGFVYDLSQDEITEPVAEGSPVTETTPAEWYGSDNFRYCNTHRLPARLVELAPSLERVIINSTVRQTTISDTYEVRLTKPVPCYVKNILYKQIFGASTIWVNGEAYEFRGGVTNALSPSVNNMFLLTITLLRECESRLQCR